jgi:hypothetical protein
MPVDIDRHLYRAVAHLFFHIDRAFTLLKEQACKRMAQVMEPDAPELGRRK